MKDLTQKVSFDFIRYSNCWEDADILLQGLSIKESSRILSIGSAGDNSFSLLITSPECVVAADINPTQLYLIELKAAGFKYLSYNEFIDFLGVKNDGNKVDYFLTFSKYLSKGCRQFWESNLSLIQNGVIHIGKFEKYFGVYRNYFLPLIQSSKNVDKLFAEKSAQEQEEFYQDRWNSWRWKLFFKFFFGERIMGKYGRDPEFLKEVKTNVSQYIFKKAERHLCSKYAQSNYFLYYMHKGNYDSCLPHYLREENFEIIKENIDKLFIFNGFAEEACNQYGSFNYMNLSNIFEYMNKNQFEKSAGTLLKSLSAGGRIGYWNLMVPRRISGLFPKEVEYCKDLSLYLTALDRGFFYNQFIIDEVK